jgi:hypothetical protein
MSLHLSSATHIPQWLRSHIDGALAKQVRKPF